jgi:hypothetical protein
MGISPLKLQLQLPLLFFAVEDVQYPVCFYDSQLPQLIQIPQINNSDVRFEVFTAVTMKNGVFWDVTPCGSCKN